MLNLEYPYLCHSKMTGEYVTYNGTGEPKRDIIKDSLDLQRLILSPEDRYYILSEKQRRQEQLLTRSAGITTTEDKDKDNKHSLTISKQLELQRLVIEGPF
jgi:hypothetical protein